MNVDYDLFEGESSTGSVRHTLCRGTMVYDRGEIVTQPGHGRFVRRSLGAPHAGGHVNADRVLEDLRELARLTGGPDGARRVCWTDEWTKARDFLRSRLDELPVEMSVDEAGNLWAAMEGDGDGFVIVGSHVGLRARRRLARRSAGRVHCAVEALRSQAEAGRPPVGLRLVDWADEEGARFGRSLFGSSCCAGTLDPDEVRDLRDRDGERLEDVVARYDVELDRARESGSRLRGARAYIEGHIEQGPVLESKGEPAATVLGTFGVERHLAVFTGETAHAGATPMPMRRDTLHGHRAGGAGDPRRRLQARGRGLHDRRRHERARRRDRGARPHGDAPGPAPPRPGHAGGHARGGARTPASRRRRTMAARWSCSTSGRSRRSRSTTA